MHFKMGRRAEYPTPKCATLTCGLFQVEDNLSLAGSGEPALNCLKEFR